MSDPLLDVEYEEPLVFPTPAPPNLVRRRTSAEDAQERLRTLRDEVMTQHSRVLLDVAYMRDIEVGADGKFPENPPQEWVDDVGEDEARKRYRIAQAAWLNGKAAPVGIQISQRVVTGIARADAQEATEVKIFNAVVFAPPVPAGAPPLEEFPILDVSGETVE